MTKQSPHTECIVMKLPRFARNDMIQITSGRSAAW